MGQGFGKHYFSVYLRTFYAFPSKSDFNKLTPPNPVRSGKDWQKMMFCVYIGRFHALSIKIIFSKMGF